MIVGEMVVSGLLSVNTDPNFRIADCILAQNNGQTHIKQPRRYTDSKGRIKYFSPITEFRIRVKEVRVRIGFRDKVRIRISGLDFKTVGEMTVGKIDPVSENYNRRIEPLPTDDGGEPMNFPSTQRELAALTDEEVLDLLNSTI
ncbi:hypothetical protein RIR_jg40375.t1 [Rhizophagus irregularis DAOM 181602=DAOM 197198]|uniref:Uncharacterized protein n=1 Tax=Rhizophagus irregularis (strain DAOM 181602 / DAOM 197198 / MUCL 43194) TaxID=747089 RepID=U9UIM6_RHIID|nr:hypothetical protein RIR_jg40375.t1 [Rhizophagus irregularis DAOM 181602=DAOM 197198]